MTIQRSACSALAVCFCAMQLFAVDGAKVATPPKAAQTSAAAQPSGSTITVNRSAIALDIVDREPRDTGTVFPPEVKRLYCFSEIGNGEGETIEHRWYWNDAMLNSVSLGVTSNRHRTYSAKTIPATMTGEWQVAIVNSKNDEVLQMVRFTIK
jgi:hypothetical protein